MSRNKPEILCLIPARGGSKSVPRKNLLEILGRPLIAWSIQQAHLSRHITRVIVSTDDQEIAEVALKYGAEVPFMRPASLAQDKSPDIETFQHAIKWLKEMENYEPEFIVHLRPTGPARRVVKIDAAIELMMLNQEADALRSVSLASQTPFKMWFLNENGGMRSAATLDGVKDAHSIARQMLPKCFWQNGYVDIVRPRTIIEKESMVGDHPIPFVIDEPVCDIDYLEDIPLVESALRAIVENHSDHAIAVTNLDRYPV